MSFLLFALELFPMPKITAVTLTYMFIICLAPLYKFQEGKDFGSLLEILWHLTGTL
jgi:hypothetical protein